MRSLDFSILLFSSISLHRSLRKAFFSLFRESQISWVKELSALLCTGRCKSLGLLKSFLHMHLSSLGPYSCVFHFLSSSVLTVGSGCNLMAARWAGIVLLPVCPQGSEIHFWRAGIPEDWCPCWLIWQEVLHFSPGRVSKSNSWMPSDLLWPSLSSLVICTVLVAVCAQACMTLCDPMDCSPPGSTIQGIFQARILEWVAVSSSRGSSWTREWTHVFCISCIGRWILYSWAKEALLVASEVTLCLIQLHLCFAAFG